MRIISGRLKGLKLQTFRGRSVRPTPDRVREALFSILADRPRNADVLDLFSGTGAMGIEAVSRGARSAVFVDHDTGALTILRKNIEKCRLADAAQVIRWDISKNLDCLRTRTRAFSLVFMDPPYARNLAAPALQHLLRANCLSPGATIVIEHEPGLTWEDPAAATRVTDRRQYGSTGLTIFSFDP